MVSPNIMGFWVISTVASSSPVRQALSHGTNPPQIFRSSPDLGSLVNGRPYVMVTRQPSITALVVSCGLKPPVEEARFCACCACEGAVLSSTTAATINGMSLLIMLLVVSFYLIE